MASGGIASMQSASRESLAEATKRLDAHVDGAAAADLATLGDDLFAVLRAARRRADAAPAPRRPGRAGRVAHAPGRPAAQRQDRSRRRSTSCPTRSRRAGRARPTWRTPSRRSPGGRRSAWPRRTAPSTRSRTSCSGSVASWTGSRSWPSSLGDRTQPVDGRVGLLKQVLGGKVSPVTATLLEQAVRVPQGRSLDRAAEELSELAAARRDRSVAHVRTPVRLSPAQEQQLTESLSRRVRAAHLPAGRARRVAHRRPRRRRRRRAHRRQRGRPLAAARRSLPS